MEVPVAEALAVNERVAELRTTYEDELETAARESEEVERLIRQTQSEAEKLAQREVTAAMQLRSLQSNIDRFSKEDIRNVYGAVQEVQMRLQLARAQVEQLQARQRRMRERRDELEMLVELFGQLDSSEDNVVVGHVDSQQTLITEVIQAQEKERLRISLQMHDGPVQTMSNLVLRAEICERLIDRDADQTRAELASLRKAITATLQDTRRFIFDLRPMILDDLGLVPTLRRYAADFGERFKLDVSVAVQNLDSRLPRHYEVALFRFVQEALNNVQKHAAASSARISLDALNNEVQLVVEDNGAGFNVAQTMQQGHSNRNMGFAVMRQQIETLLQGQLGVESVLGKGTRVVATISLRD
jgi:two-component system, NarL family, sensor histidine kinase DegS